MYLNDLYKKDKYGDVEPQAFAFFDEIEKRLSNLSVERISLHDFEGRYNQYGYQAVDVATGFTKRPTHRKDVSNRYYESVADGAEELTWFIEDRITSCPFQQIILGGYSQGAHVVGDALFKIKPSFRTRIAQVALYGDPKFNPRTNFIPTKIGSWAKGNALSMDSGILLPRKEYIPDGTFGTVKSWCDVSDPICSAYGLGQNIVTKSLYEKFVDQTHTNIYQNKWIPQGANEIVNSLKDRNLLASQVQNFVFINKNDKLYQLDLAIVIDGTASMQDMLNNIRFKIKAFVSGLYRSYWDTRVAVVAFSDNSFSWMPTYFSKVLTDFTYSKDTITKVFNNLWPEQNADDPEAQLSGLRTAMNDLTWRQGAQKKILVITDVYGKDPDPGPGHWTKQDATKRALELDPVSISFLRFPVSKYITRYDSDIKYLTEATNGTITKALTSYNSDDILKALANMDYQPVANITGIQKGLTGETVYFNGDDSYDPDSSIKEYAWDCENNGSWDIVSNNPNAECIYIQPYTGLVVLEVRSQDGGSAKAILDIEVTNHSLDAPVENLEVPVASATRSDEEVIIEWSNFYSENVIIDVLDNEGNLIGQTAASDQKIILDGMADESYELKIMACNQSICSSSSTVIVPAKLTPSIEPAKNEDAENEIANLQVPETIISRSSTSELQNAPTNTQIATINEAISEYQSASTANTSGPVNSQPVTNVAGATKKQTNNEQSNQPTNNQDNSKLPIIIGATLSILFLTGFIFRSYYVKERLQ